MNKTAIKNYAIWARIQLIESCKQRAYEYGITEDGDYTPNLKTVGSRILTEQESEQRNQLIEQIRQKGYVQVMEEAAYTWFNRFIALRFMEVNGYLPSKIRVFTDETGAFKPEILKEAMTIDLDGIDKSRVIDLLEKQDNEVLYKYLLITQCNALKKGLPCMFETIGGWTELLFPSNLLRQDSVIGQMITEIPEEDWTDAVEVIGWLYQYYNIDLFNEIYDGDNSKRKIKKEQVPAATQLFTPDWVVRYMVENSLGRLWFEGHDSFDISSWKYYVEDIRQNSIVEEKLKAIYVEHSKIKPEEIKIIDPCMGSGHILVYAFDVLMQIYISSGWSERDAAISIINNNLYGLDIDDRAGQLAYFAIMMKARKHNRRILNGEIKPNVLSVQESNWMTDDFIEYVAGNDTTLRADLFTLRNTFWNAKEYGSILLVPCMHYDAMFERIDSLNRSYANNLLEEDYRLIVVEHLLPLVKQSQIMSQRYDVVITNPPYLGSSRFDASLSEYVKQHYKDEKSDLATIMLRRMIDGFAEDHGFIAAITTVSWMFISSFQKFRVKFLHSTDFVNLVDFGTELFEGKIGHLPVASWVNRKSNINPNAKAIRLVEFCFSRRNEKEPEFFNKRNHHVFNSQDFEIIPSTPIAYWIGKNAVEAFKKGISIDSISDYTGSQNKTAGNDKYLRLSWEVEKDKFGPGKKWIVYAKGGDYRKHYGNVSSVIDWSETARSFYNSNPTSNLLSERYWYQEGITYTMLTTRGANFRYMPDIGAFDMGGPEICRLGENLYYVLAFLNSKLTQMYLSLLNPTINLQAKDVKALPLIIDPSRFEEISNLERENVALSKLDWDSFETSWGFERHPLVNGAKRISDAYSLWEKECLYRFERVHQNEERINELFIQIYNLSDEMSPTVDKRDITVSKPDRQREIKSLISYAVGCAFGRFSLDKSGLCYAGGEWNDSYYKTIIPDADNIIPICDDDYFEDDIVGKVIEFIRLAFGEEHLEENLRYIADSIGSGKGMSREVIRSYMFNEFYADHCANYSITNSGRRPVYWLFSSGKKNGFKCLIYMHRYKPDLIARIRTDYIFEQQGRYATAIADLEYQLQHASGADKARINKSIIKYKEQEEEIHRYEEKVHHLADQMISINLDDGVKANYAKFQDVLEKLK